MTAKKLDDQQIQSRIDMLDALAQSGQSAKAFAQTQGMSYAQLRGWQAHGARWRAQQAASRPSQQEPALVQPSLQTQLQPPQELVTQPAVACDFIQVQVTPEAADTNGGASGFAHAIKAASGAGDAFCPITPTAWVEPPPVENAYLHAAPTTRPGDLHHPPNPAPVRTPVQILCTQGPRSALVHWPSTAPLECAQWLRAYLA